MLTAFIEGTRLFAEVIVPIFMYLLVIGLVWWGIRSALPSGAALLLAAAAVVGLGFLVPLAANVSTRSAYAQAIGSDAIPGDPVKVSGDIFLDDVRSDALPSRTGRRYSEPEYPSSNTCGPLCRALLATPGVTSVTVEPAHRDERTTPSPDAVTYRPSTGFCGMPAFRSYDPIDRDGSYSDLGTVACVMGGPPIDRVDLRVVVTWQQHGVPALWNTLWIERFEMIDHSNHVLMRRTRASSLLTSVPFRTVLHAPMKRRIFDIPTTSGPGPSENPPFPRAGTLLLAHTSIERD